MIRSVLNHCHAVNCVLLLHVCIALGCAKSDAGKQDNSLSTNSTTGTIVATDRDSLAADEDAFLKSIALLLRGEKKFVCRTSITPNQLSRLVEYSNLEHVELYDASKLSSEDLIAAIGQMPKLRRLRLEAVSVDDRVMESIAGLRELETLNLPDGSFSDVGLASVCELPKLSLLRIGSGNVTDQGIAHIAAMKMLRFLHLKNIPVTDAGLENFHDADQLESFYLDNGNESEDGIRELLKHNPRLHFHRNLLHIAEDPNADGH